MGTGGLGGGGGGGGGSGGAGGGVAGWGGYTVKEGKLIATSVTQEEAESQVREAIHSLLKSSGEYFGQQIGGPLVDGVFRGLFVLSECLRQADPVLAIHKAFGIDAAAPFVNSLRNVLFTAKLGQEPDQRMQSTVLMCFDAFVQRALGRDLRTFLSGTAADFVASADRALFASLSGHFLGILLWQVVSRELSGVSTAAEGRLRSATQAVAERVIASFQERYLGKDVGYPDLLRTIRTERKWFRRITT